MLRWDMLGLGDLGLWKLFLYLSFFLFIIYIINYHLKQALKHMQSPIQFVNVIEPYEPVLLSNIVITFRKLISREQELNNKKILITVVTNSKQNVHKKIQKNIYEITRFKKIKNNIACFYGESLVINNIIKNFSICIYQEIICKSNQNKKLLHQFFIDNRKLSNFSFKKLYLTSHSELFDLFWEVQIQSQHRNRSNQSQEDRLLEDFDDIEITNITHKEKEKIGRNSYSPIPIRQIFNRRHISNNENKLQQVSQSMKKLTANTNQTTIKINNKIQLTQPIQYKKNKQNTKFLDQIKKKITAEQNLNKSFDEQQQYQNMQKKDRKKEEQQKFEHPILHLKKNKIQLTQSLILDNPIDIKSLQSIKSSKKSSKTTRNKMERFYHKISLDTLLYTSMIGIIGGVTAAQL